MPGVEFRRTRTTYAPTGPTARAALDFAIKSSCFKNFGSAYHGWTADEMRKTVIAWFEDRKATSAVFLSVTPEVENCRQLFLITFAPLAHGFEPELEIEIKSVETLRTQAKRYKADATAYAATRKPKRTRRRLDEAL